MRRLINAAARGLEVSPRDLTTRRVHTIEEHPRDLTTHRVITGIAAAIIAGLMPF